MGRLSSIETLLRNALGDGLVSASPDLVYGASRVLFRFGRTETPETVWNELDSLLFNAVYARTDGSMMLDNRRVRSAELKEISDRLLSLAYRDREPEPALKDALFDLARAGSFAAMRELVGRYPLDEDERAFLMRVLEENGELE